MAEVVVVVVVVAVVLGTDAVLFSIGEVLASAGTEVVWVVCWGTPVDISEYPR